jgi:hypothetical protein
MYPRRRFALPWAISFCPFGAAGSMVDCHLPGPSTPAEDVPALRAYAPQDATYRGLRPRQRVCQPFGPMQPQDCYLPGPSTPAEGVPALWAYGPQDATYRGLRPRQRVCRPFGPMSHRMLLSGAFDPGRGCAGPSGLCATRLLLTDAQCTQGGASLCLGLSPFAPSGRPDRWLTAILSSSGHGSIHAVRA